MQQKARRKLIHALWSIHGMFQDLNEGNNPDAEQVDTLEEEIKELEDMIWG